jgi:hypothetical protein
MPTFSNPKPSFKLELLTASRLKITDMTGAYQTQNNPDGWGGPFGANISDTTNCAITMKDRNGNAYQADFIGYLPSDSYGSYITNMSEFFNLDGSGLWGHHDEEFPDGIYSVSYAVGNQAFREWLYIPYRYILIATKLQCCVTKKLADIKFDCCEDDETQKLMTIQLLFDAMGYAACCGNLEKAQELYDLTEKLCNLGDCGCSK